MRRLKQSAFTLVELIVAMVVMAIAVGILVPLARSISSSSTSADQLVAMQLARARIDMIIASKAINGFDAMSDPCTGGSPPSNCTLPTGYSIDPSTISTGWEGSNRFKVITVAISGKGTITLKSLVGDNS